MTTTPAPMKGILAGFVFLLAILVTFSAQTPVPSPATTPEVSPTPSPSPTPLRAPSPTPLPGVQNFHQWGSITVFNGLPSDSIRAIAQTQDGVMWFGTDNGLARFDGRRVQTIPLGGPDVERVLTLAIESTGELWVGTDSGAFVLTNGNFMPIEGTNDMGVTAILIESANVVLGTDTGLVLRVSAGTRESIPMIEAPVTGQDGSPLSIGCLVRRSDKLLACTTGKGVVEIGPTSVTEFMTSPRPLFVRSLIEGDDGKLWLGADAAKGVSGVYVSDTDLKPMRIPAPTANVFALETNDGGVWAGTERYGLFQFTGGKLKKNFTFENTSGGLRSNNIFTLFTDREGVLWIGTNRGVSRFDRMGASQETVSDIPNSNFIRTLSRVDTLYAGSNRGLFTKEKADLETDSEGDDDHWIEVPGLKNRAIYAIKQRSSDAHMVGTPEGMFDLSGRKLSNGDFRSFAEFKQKYYAAVYGRGVLDVTGIEQKAVFTNPAVTSVSDGQDRLWIGTAGQGLFSYDGTAVKIEAAPADLKSGAIWNMFQAESDGSLYIAGQHGLFIFRNGSIKRVIGVEDVRDVVEKDGGVWAATTTRGLFHARRDERFGWLVSAMGFEQGLPSEKAFSIRLAGDALLIATNRGVVKYKPGTIAPKLIPTRVLSQRAHDLSELKSPIALDYPQNSLLVEVAGQSSRTFPEEFQYAFLLQNGKGEIIDRRISNDAQYAPADLGPGEYTIESRAFNRDLLASEPLLIKFSVAKAPFPWTATALGALLLLSLVGLVWAIIEHRRIAHRNRELAAARLDLANEAERERRRIARDLHDQTLADLRNLMITSDKLTGDNREFRNEIEAVSTEIRRICEDLSPSVLENVGLVAALEFLLDRTVANRKFTAEASVEDRIEFPLNVQLQIYRIAQEVLTNIVRHSSATEVSIEVEVNEGGDFAMKIRDNGDSFQPEGVQKGRGIANIRSRANLINGKVEWKESRRGGNVFSLRVERVNVKN